MYVLLTDNLEKSLTEAINSSLVTGTIVNLDPQGQDPKFLANRIWELLQKRFNNTVDMLISSQYISQDPLIEEEYAAFWSLDQASRWQLKLSFTSDPLFI